VAKRIEVKSTDVETFSGHAKATGRAFSMHKQTGWMHGDEAYPEKIELVLRDPLKPYPPGLYVIDYEKSIYVDRNQRVAINPVLMPAPVEARKTA
jgi:hypothetical protein